MNAEQRIRKHILTQAALDGHITLDPATITAENVARLYEEHDGEDCDLQDYESEFRCSGEATGLKCRGSRHYESDAVAKQLPDGSWVGWTYWYGGGKHGEPEAVDWMDEAYELTVKEEQKMVTVRTFAVIEPQPA